MPDLVYLNGELVPAGEARVSVFDHGFLYGDGLFETMRVYNGKVFRLDDHLARLEKSAAKLELPLQLTGEELGRAIYATVAGNGLPDAVVRLTLTRGVGPAGIDPRLCSHPTLVITTRKAPSYDQKLYSEGIGIIITETRRNLTTACPPELKSLNFLNNILAKMELNRAGVTEGIMLNHRGEVAEGTVSNVFVYKAGRLLTPALTCGILPGITRSVVLDIAAENSIEAVETVIMPEELTAADEVFLTNSGSEITPVVRIGSRDVGSGKPGPVTMRLLECYRREAWQTR